MSRTFVAGLGLAAVLTTHVAAEPDPDARDRGDFWREVVSPHHDEVTALKAQLRDALAAIISDGNPEHRAGLVLEATRMARYARQLDPGDVELLYYLAALADEGGHSAAAQRQLVDYVSRTPRPSMRLDALVRLGKIALRQRRPELAIGALRQALAERGDRRSTAAAAIYLAHALDAAGRTGDAIDLLASQIATQPGAWEAEDAAIWLALATLYDRDEQISQAFELVMTAQNVLGAGFAERMEAGLAAVPPVPAPEIHYTRAFVYETAGFLLEARAEWQSYLRMTTVARYRDRAAAHLAAIDGLLAARRGPASRPARPRRSP
ncbi:MAG TPA: tetratricopeptide repeat protein [Kofleriaceae bacterium]|nr:tetratricopeptide repeat protein [Kofleriaceae bacterium]